MVQNDAVGSPETKQPVGSCVRTDRALRESEELQLLVSGVKDYAILMLDTEGRVTTWNEGAERIKGYRAEEIIGQNVSKFYTPEAIAAKHPEKELELAAAQGRYQEEGWRVRKDGSRFFADVVITAVRDEAGDLRGFGKVTRDVTERRNAQAQLFFEKERAQVTLNSIGDAVISTDSLGHVAFLDEVARQLTRWSMNEAVGRPIVEVLRVINAVSREVTTDPSGTAVIQNRTMSLPSNTMLVRRDGVEIPTENSISPIRDRAGEVTGGVIVFRDMSGAREMAQRTAHLAQHDFLSGLPNRRLLKRKFLRPSRRPTASGVIWRWCSWTWTASNISRFLGTSSWRPTPPIGGRATDRVCAWFRHGQSAGW